MASGIVAIVGRPNVGKSAIFNRLAGRRIAIVHHESGVTRDRLVAEAEWANKRFSIMDTGGICTMDESAGKNSFEDRIKEQAKLAVSESSVVIMATDITAGVMPMDEEVARILRKSGRKVFLAANKADNPKLDGLSVDFELFGFPVFPVSALHNRGFAELMDAILPSLPENIEQDEEKPLLVSVVGRPNVGKSSYINKLLKDDRVMVSEIPGTTRDSVDIPFSLGNRRYVLIDTAGIGKHPGTTAAVERYSRQRSEESISRSDISALIIDATSGATARDKKIASLIIEKGKGCVLLVNKWDLRTSSKDEFKEELYRQMPFMSFCPIAFISAKTGFNIKKSVELIDHVASQIKLQISTGLLTRALIDAAEHVSPPSVGGRRLKIFYAVQTGNSPVSFKVFVNQPELVKDSYKGYLVRVIREQFGFEGAPIVLRFCNRR